MEEIFFFTKFTRTHLPYLSRDNGNSFLNRDIKKKKKGKQRGEDRVIALNSDKFTISPPFPAASIIN